jgi:membrane-associated phospholipid phosphatase
MIRYLITWAIVAALGFYAVTPAAANDANVMATDILTGAVPLTGLAVAYFKGDTEGQKQWLRNTCVNQGLTSALRLSFNETSLGERPDGDPYGFPSGHVAAVMSGATFLDMRYGWKWGVPAYLASAYVAYVRVDEDQHHWRDVIASGVLSYGVAMLFVTPEKATYLAPIIGPDFIGLRWGRSF